MDVGRPDHNESRRALRVVAPALSCAALIVFGAAGCGTTDEASRQTLPPLVTTTTSTVPPTTIPVDRTYEVKPGDILTVIAAEYGVTVEAIMEANDLPDQDDIEAGQTLRIPGG